MVMVTFSISENYWENFQLRPEDTEFIYNLLLELETPLTSSELVAALVDEHIQQQKTLFERQRTAAGQLYQPKGQFAVDQRLVFPAFGWQQGQVTAIRPGFNPDLGEFSVVNVVFSDGTQREFAAGLAEHALNEPPKFVEDADSVDKQVILDAYLDPLVAALEDELETSPDFVRIAGRWFPRALLVDINIGHLNLAEAVLDMAGGGPLPTSSLLEQIDLSSAETGVNARLIEFSMDLALQDDPRFDEVGPSGDVLWYLQRLEPPEVLTPPIYLRYAGIDYVRENLTDEMQALEQYLDDELSGLDGKSARSTESQVRLIFPHWRSGTLPLSGRVRHLFPTAYEAPRIRFMLIDGDTGDHFPAWVVRQKRYVLGLKDWYQQRGLMPGSIVHVRKGDRPGEVIVQTDSRRSNREWIRTVLVGSDGGIVFAMLKQIVNAPFDDRMAIAIPDPDALDPLWNRAPKDQVPFERLVINMVRELAKLNPQSHVHASELYAAINVVRRCPPAPLLALLASNPALAHVGDLHFRLVSDADHF